MSACTRAELPMHPGRAVAVRLSGLLHDELDSTRLFPSVATADLERPLDGNLAICCVHILSFRARIPKQACQSNDAHIFRLMVQTDDKSSDSTGSATSFFVQGWLLPSNLFRDLVRRTVK
jgi:hypothetical protein